MDVNLRRRSRERGIAEEIASELQRVLGPLTPERLIGDNRDVVEKVFGDAFDRHHVVSESVGARILAFVPGELARLNFKFSEFNRRLDAAIRPAIKPEQRLGRTATRL